MCPGKFYKLKLYKIISEPVQTPAPLMSWQETQLNCSQVKEVIVVISEMKEGFMSEISKSITHEHYSCFEARITEFSAYFLF